MKGFRVLASRAEKRQLARLDELPTLAQMALLGELGILPKFRNAQEIATYASAATALTTAQVAFMGPVLSVPQTPLVLALAYIPTVVTQTAAATIVLNINRTDTPAVIGGSTYLTPTAGTVNSAPITMFAIVPFGIPAANGVSVSGSDTAASAVPTGSTTRPMILALLGLS